MERDETIGGIHVHNNGEIADGKIITCTAVFTAADFATLLTYSGSDTLYALTGPGGESLGNRRVIVRGYSPDGLRKTPKYYSVTLEFWAV